ncbi:MAG: ABC transporter substrate-binding protein [Varibaculum sp.]
MAQSDITSVKQLKGKKIGYVPNSSQEMALRLLLKSEGLDPDSDVEMVNIGYSEMSEALERGDVDAFAGAEMGVSLPNLPERVKSTPSITLRSARSISRLRPAAR